MTIFRVGFSFLFVFAYTSASCQEPNLHSGCREYVAFMDASTEPRDMKNVAYCAGFVAGTTESIMFWKALNDKALNICLPPEVNRGQATRIFVKYVDDHPEEIHKPDFVLFLYSMAEAFPCWENTEQ